MVPPARVLKHRIFRCFYFMKIFNKNALVHVLHFLIILFCWLSPFILSWKLILVGILLYYLQNIFLKGCLVSYLQFGNHEETMYSYYLTKLHINFNRKKLRFVTDHIFPWVILLIALIYQCK